MNFDGDPYVIPGLPDGGNLGTYTSDSIEQGAHGVVEAFAPLIEVAIPFAIGYMLLMWAADWVLDHLPWSGDNGVSSFEMETYIMQKYEHRYHRDDWR
jgi:hypothetical protein